MKWYDRDGLVLLVGLLILANILDVVSTYLAVSVTDHGLEANPLMNLFGGNLHLVILTVCLFMFLVIYLYIKYFERMKMGNRHYYLLLFVLVIVLKCFAAYNNFGIYLNPPPPEQVQAVVEAYAQNPELRVQAYSGFVLPAIIFGFIVPLLTFWIFSKEHKIELKGYNE